MKNIHATAYILTFAFPMLLALGCGSGDDATYDTPEAVVIAYIEAMIDNDLDGYISVWPRAFLREIAESHCIVEDDLMRAMEQRFYYHRQDFRLLHRELTMDDVLVQQVEVQLLADHASPLAQDIEGTGVRWVDGRAMVAVWLQGQWDTGWVFRERGKGWRYVDAWTDGHVRYDGGTPMIHFDELLDRCSKSGDMPEIMDAWIEDILGNSHASEMTVKELVRALADENEIDSYFEESLRQAQKSADSGADFVEAFVAALEEIDPQVRVSRYFRRSSGITRRSTNTEVATFLQEVTTRLRPRQES